MSGIAETVVVVTEPFEGSAVDRWEHLIAEAMTLRPARLVIDLARCPRLDAAAIGVLLRAHRAMVGAGGALALRGTGAEVRHLLAVARLDHVFTVDSPEAVRA